MADILGSNFWLKKCQYMKGWELSYENTNINKSLILNLQFNLKLKFNLIKYPNPWHLNTLTRHEQGETEQWAPNLLRFYKGGRMGFVSICFGSK